MSFRDDGSAHLHVRRSKTDQPGEGAVRYVAPEAAARLRRWMDTAGIESGPCSGPRPLFRPVPGRRIGKGRLGPDAVRAVIKRRAAQAGITRHVSGHTLRIGAALSLAERNVSVAEMQREGDGSRRRCRATSCATRRRPGAPIGRIEGANGPGL